MSSDALVDNNQPEKNYAYNRSSFNNTTQQHEPLRRKVSTLTEDLRLLASSSSGNSSPDSKTSRLLLLNSSHSSGSGGETFGVENERRIEGLLKEVLENKNALNSSFKIKTKLI